MRWVWRAVGLAAGDWCLLTAVTLIGMSLWAWRSPESFETSGPSPWLVLTPQVVLAFAVSRWAWRHGRRRSGSVVTSRSAGTVETG